MDQGYMAQQLLSNFDAFKDPKTPWWITHDSLKNVAGQRLTGNVAQDQNILLARKSLKDPEFMRAIDRHSDTGAYDGLIDRRNLQIVINDSSPFASRYDKDLTREMLDRFNGLKDPHLTSYIKVEKLKDMANWPLTGDRVMDELIYVAKEAINRAYLMDSLAKNGLIHRSALQHYPR